MRAVLLAVCLVVGAGLAGPAEAITCSPNGLPAFPNPTGSLYGATAPTWQQYFGAKVDVNNGVLCNPTINGVPFNGVPVSNVLPPLSINSGGQLSLTTPLVGTYGGTGVNNGSSTITLGGSLVTGGALTFANLPTANQLLYVSSANNVGYSAIGSGLVLGATTGTNVALVAANNLSDVASAPTARTNLSIAPHVATEVALAASSTATYPSGVWRDDYSAGLGAPPLFYTASGSACSLNAGAGDGGSQVPSADSKCWLAQFPTTGADPREWGVSVSATDNTTAGQAAVAWAVANNATLYFPSGTFKFSSHLTATLTVANTSLSLAGDGPDKTTLLWPTGGGLLVNRNVATGAVHFRDLTIMTGAVNTGIGIDVEGGTVHNSNAASSTFDRLHVLGQTSGTDYWASGIKLNGISQVNFNSVDIQGDNTGGGSGSHSIDLDLEATNGPTNYSFITNIVNSNFFGALYGIKYGSYVQGIAITNVNFTLNWNGIYAPVNATGQSELAITNSQFDNTGDNILFDTGTSSPQVMLTNNLFFLVAGTDGLHAKGTISYSTIIGSNCSTTTGSLISASCVEIDSNAGASTIVDDTSCINIATCVVLGSAATGVRVSNTRSDTGATAEYAVTNNNTTGQNNIITGLNYSGSSANNYPQGFLVSAAANNGSGAVRLTTSSTTGLQSGQVVFASVPGVANMPGMFQITVVDATHVDLVASNFAGTYTSGGIFWIMP